MSRLRTRTYDRDVMYILSDVRDNAKYKADILAVDRVIRLIEEQDVSRTFTFLERVHSTRIDGKQRLAA